MKRELEFLRECKTFYIATTDGDQPRVLPTGAVFEYEGKLSSFKEKDEILSLY